MPRHFTEAEKGTIKADLLKAARKLFIWHGFSKTTIADITKEACIGKGSFYQFYNSKGDIFLEIYRMEREKIRRRIVDEHSHETGDFKDKLRNLIFNHISILQNNPILKLIYEPGSLDAIMDKAVERRLSEYNRETNRALMAVIDDWLGGRTGDHEEAVIVGAIRGITLLRHHISAIGPEIYQDVIDALINWVVEGAAARLKCRIQAGA